MKGDNIIQEQPVGRDAFSWRVPLYLYLHVFTPGSSLHLVILDIHEAYFIKSLAIGY